MRLVNPLVRRLVARGLFGDSLLVLHLTGRRTGRRLDVPVGHHALDDATVVLTNSPWRHNLVGGRTVDVTLRGVRGPATATLVEDPGAVADAYVQLVGRLGWPAAGRRLGLRTTTGRAPTRADLLDAARVHGLSLVRLELRPGA